MPRDWDLPDDIRGLADRNAIRVRPDPDFPEDLGKLVALLRDRYSDPWISRRPSRHARLPAVQPQAPTTPLGGTPLAPSGALPPARWAQPETRGNVEDAGTTHWLQVHEQFMATKKECGESVEGPTYEKFEQTLKKSRAALMKQRGAKHVKFAVYVKDGKAALKARLIKH
jgi:hypothetical protein